MSPDRLTYGSKSISKAGSSLELSSNKHKITLFAFLEKRAKFNDPSAEYETPSGPGRPDFTPTGKQKFVFRWLLISTVSPLRCHFNKNEM
ncbi:hypothetical protein HanIR_Chr15g0732951 [Helianthus annuus]|nr:hypothetical protein HanIR_Chr15g0732951 [Helianthus annuus]